MVARELIEEIRSRLNLVAIVEQVVPLKKSGRNCSGRCPFHQDKSPSFTVSEEKQLYHCFGCGAGGTVFNFLMSYHQIPFPEALERAAQMAGVEIRNRSAAEDERIRKTQEKKRKLSEVLALAAESYHRYFLNSDAAQTARAYAKGRGMDPTIAKHYQIGYAPDSWDTFARFLAKRDASMMDAKDAGLVGAKQKGGYFDFFRNRLIFPIRDPEGKTIGLGGRILGEGTPKYLNSPQTLVFDKGKNLYGLFEAKDSIRTEKNVYVVEGYMDQIAMFAAGFPNTVATLGTALTADHAKLLKRYTDRITLLFDGDAAGLRAIQRAMLPVLEAGLSAYVVVIPDRDDPDSYLKKNGAGPFSKLAESAVPVMHFFLERNYLAEADVAKKAAAVSQIVAMVRGANPYLKEALIRDVRDTTGLTEAVLRGEESLAPARSSAVARPTRIAAQPSSKATGLFEEEWTLLRVSAECPDARERLFSDDAFEYFSSEPLAAAARDWLAQIAREPDRAGASDLVDRWPDEETRSAIAKVFMMQTRDFSSEWKKVYADCLSKMKGRKISALTQAMESAERSGDAGQVTAISRKVLELKKSSEKAKPRA